MTPTRGASRRAVENLAVVLYEAHGTWRTPELSKWDQADEQTRDLYRHMASAALRALGEEDRGE